MVLLYAGECSSLFTVPDFLLRPHNELARRTKNHLYGGGVSIQKRTNQFEPKRVEGEGYPWPPHSYFIHLSHPLGHETAEIHRERV